MSIFALIPILPLLAFLVISLGGKRLGAVGNRVGVPAVGLSAVLTIVAFYHVVVDGPIAISLYTLIDVGATLIEVDLYVDQLTVLLLLLVTVGSFIVHVYSASYMIGDPRYQRFFAVMALFTFAMVMLVMSNNLLVTYMCWEVMGICSYLLISHWAHREAAAKAATKAFLVNAIADVGLGFGVVLTLSTYGTLNIQDILAAVGTVGSSDINLLSWLGLEWSMQRNTLITLCLLSGALGKSAQFPMHVWLPFAMEAPTPISALIHAATMVNAGPFLLARMAPLVLTAPAAMGVIAVVGMTTALYGGLVSLTQSDIKKSLAYSTISHIGFMIFACGVGAFAAAIFHVLAHGFLKGFLFLSTGDALESASHQGHGGKRERLPPAVSAGALVLALIPAVVIFWGPYEQLWNVHQTPSARIAFWVVALATVFLTAGYVYRTISSLFGHRVGNSRTVPNLFAPAYLIGVGSLTVFVGGFLVFGWAWFARFLAPAIGAQPLSSSAPIVSPWMVVPVIAVVAGWAFAILSRASQAGASSAWKKRVYVAFLNRLYVDEIYDAYLVKPFLQFCDWLIGTVEKRGVERFVQLIGSLSLTLSAWLWSALEVRGLDRSLNQSATSSVSLSRWLLRVVDLRGDAMVGQLGRISDETGEMLHRIEPRTLQHHLVVVVFWLMLAIALSYWLVR